MVSRLVLVLGDQLSEDLAALREADPDRDVVVMAEVAAETGYAPHHPKKIALVLAAMRKFAARLRDQGWTVRYTQLDDTENAGSIPGELLRRAEETGISRVLATEPGEWRLIEALREMGHGVEAGRGENSGIHIARVSDGGYIGAADPRRDGVALGLGEDALEE